MRFHLPAMSCAVAALVVAGAAIAACDDPVPTAALPPVDTAELEQAAERVNAAADRLSGAAQQLEETIALERAESDAIFINADALRLLALLSQLEIEIRIIDALLDPPRDIRLSRWPLEPEDGAALGFASTRFFWLHHQLSTFAASPTQSLPIFQDEETFALLAELQGELQVIGRSAYAAWKAHEAGEPSLPATRPTTVAQTHIDQLIEAAGALLVTDRKGAAAIPGATWNAVNALERLGWAAQRLCFAWDCYGGSHYRPLDFRERAVSVYAIAELRAARRAATEHFPGELENARCRLSVRDGASALTTAAWRWSLSADRFRDAKFDSREDGLGLSFNSLASPIALYRNALLACTLSLARSSP